MNNSEKNSVTSGHDIEQEQGMPNLKAFLNGDFDAFIASLPEEALTDEELEQIETQLTASFM